MIDVAFAEALGMTAGSCFLVAAVGLGGLVAGDMPVRFAYAGTAEPDAWRRDWPATPRGRIDPT